MVHYYYVPLCMYYILSCIVLSLAASTPPHRLPSRRRVVLSITGHVYTPAYVLVSDSGFSKLPADVQSGLKQCATETQAFVYDTAARLENELLDVIKAAGVAVNNADEASNVLELDD